MTSTIRRPRCRRIVIAFLVAARWISTSYVPTWWRQGWPRKHLDSLAEGELLAPLADLLMPQMPIRELFRSFPAPEDWGGGSLQPDLAAHGVLRKKDAALFVEYDGYYRHGEKAGVLRDEAKNVALLSFAPEGSLVIRISHARKSALKGNVFWIHVGPWRQSDRKSLSKTLQIILQKIMNAAGQLFHPDVVRRIQQALQQEKTVSVNALDFMNEARLPGCGNTTAEISQFLINYGFSIRDTGLMSIASVNGMCIAEALQPRIHWLMSLGLTRHQVAKVVARFPRVLGLSIEQNLKPTVQWLTALGLSKGQMAKAVGSYPRVLGLSIEQNLKPTVQWLTALGLSKGQMAKAVCGSPSLLGLSIEQNLKPTVHWLMSLGLSKGQIAKAVGSYPRVLGFSIEQNLKPTVQWLTALGLSKGQVAKAVAGFPFFLGLSIEQNLQPTVHWLKSLGLSKGQVASAIVIKPQLLGYSLEKNLRPKYDFLRRSLGVPGTASLIAKRPTVLGYSMLRVAKRMNILARRNMTAKLASYIDLTEARFRKRFSDWCQIGTMYIGFSIHACSECYCSLFSFPLWQDIALSVPGLACCNLSKQSEETYKQSHGFIMFYLQLGIFLSLKGIWDALAPLQLLLQCWMLECHVCLQMCWILTYWIILGSGLSLLIKPPTFIVMKMLEWKQQMSVLQYCHCEIVEYLGIPEVELVEGQRRWKKMRKTANMFARAWNLLADSSIPWNDFARLNLNEASLVYFNIFNTVLASAPGPFVGNCRWGGTGRTMSPY